MPLRLCPELCTRAACSRCSLVSVECKSSSLNPRTPFSGVRISWLMVARKADLASAARAAARASSLADSTRASIVRAMLLKDCPSTASSPSPATWTLAVRSPPAIVLAALVKAWIGRADALGEVAAHDQGQERHRRADGQDLVARVEERRHDLVQRPAGDQAHFVTGERQQRGHVFDLAEEQRALAVARLGLPDPPGPQPFAQRLDLGRLLERPGDRLRPVHEDHLGIGQHAELVRHAGIDRVAQRDQAHDLAALLRDRRHGHGVVPARVLPDPRELLTRQHGEHARPVGQRAAAETSAVVGHDPAARVGVHRELGVQAPGGRREESRALLRARPQLGRPGHVTRVLGQPDAALLGELAVGSQGSIPASGHLELDEVVDHRAHHRRGQEREAHQHGGHAEEDLQPQGRRFELHRAERSGTGVMGEPTPVLVDCSGGLLEARGTLRADPGQTLARAPATA